MIIIERNQVRKIFYSGYITIMLLLIIILSGLFVTSLNSEYQIKIEQLKESIVNFKKSYIKETVSIIFQEITIENEAIRKGLQTDADTISLSIMQYLEPLYGVQKSYNVSLLSCIPKHIDVIIYDIINQTQIANSDNFKPFKHNDNPNHILTIIKTYPVSSIQHDPSKRFFVAVYVTQQTIEALIREKLTNRIRNTRLLDNGYIWVNQILNYDGGENYAIRLIHPNLPHTEGMFLSTFSTDIKGNLPYKEELEGVKKNGDVFLEYFFKKKDSKKTAHKLSYGKLYKPYDWVIATGVYLDDVAALLQKEKTRMSKTYKKTIAITIALAIVCICCSGIIMYIFESFLYKLIQNYNNTINDREKSLRNEKLSAQNALVKADESEQRFRYLFQNMREAFSLGEVIFDSDGAPTDLLFIEINRGFELTLNTKRNCIVGKKATEVLPGILEDRAGWLSIFSDVVKTGQSKTIESYSESSKKWFYVNTYKIKGNQIATVFMDISPLKEKEKLAGVLELSGAVCHELSQPLQIITGYCDLLFINKKPSDSNYIRKLKIEVERMSEIIQRLSQITRYETLDFPQGTIIDIKKSSLKKDE